MSRTSRLRRGLVLLSITLAAGAATTMLACKGDEASSEDDTFGTNSVFVPAEAAAQNPLPPGVAPHADDPNPTPPPPKDAGGTTPTDASTPKSDAGAGDAS